MTGSVVMAEPVKPTSPARMCLLEGAHGMCLTVLSKNNQHKLGMSMHRGDLEVWAIQQVDGAGRKNFLVTHNGRWLATRNDGEQGFYLASSPTTGSIWELIPVPMQNNRFYLKSVHGKHLASLDDRDQTLYMSPSQKEWERWRVIPAAHAATCGNVSLPDRRLQVLLEVPEGHLECPVEQAVERFLRHEPSKAYGVPMQHHHPERPVFYGRWFGLCRTPVVFLEAPCEAVTRYLCEDPVGPFANLEKSPPTIPVEPEGPWHTWDFEADEEEKLLKADWHTLPHLKVGDELFVPRFAKSSRLCRAPPRIMAFAMALRAMNQPLWAAVVEALTALRRARERDDEEYRKEGRGRLLGTLIECFKNNRHFGVVEAQVRWGDERLRQPSHMDGATSLVHLGLTLGGCRTLRAGVFPNMDTESVGKNVWDEDVWDPGHLQEMRMAPGSTYLSSPFCFEHAVQYEPCGAQEPMIALMCRFGFPKDLGPHINNMRTDDMLDITTVIATCLKTACSRGQLRMPSLAEVRQGEAQLERLDSHRAFVCS